MSPAVSSLLRRLVSLVAGASAAAPAVNAAPNSAGAASPNDRFDSVRTEKGRMSKLVFGKARPGSRMLASHRSHSSHSSHSSHASHYSGSSGGDSYPYVAPPPPKPPPAKPKPAAPNRDQPSASERTALDAVRKKLPRIRSHWPTEAVLTRETRFNLYDGDKVIGVITLNPGTKIRIVAIKLEHVLILLSGNESPLPLENTDIVDRMGGADKILAYPDDGTSTAGDSAKG